GNSQSSKKPLLSLACIFALACYSQADWVINTSDTANTTNSIDATISNNITLNNKNSAVYTTTSGSGQMGSLTINDGVTISSNKNDGKGIIINGGTQVNNITNNGTINAHGQGIEVNRNARVETITIGATGILSSTNRRAIIVNTGGQVNHIDVQGSITGGRGVFNSGTIGVNGTGTSSPNGIKVTGSIMSSDNSAAAIENHGTINGGIDIESGTLTGGRNATQWRSYYISVYNHKMLNGSIKVGENATLMGGIANANPYGQNGVAVLNGNIEVAGKIYTDRASQYDIFNIFATINGDIIIKDTATLSNGIWNQGVINGKIEVDGTINTQGGHSGVYNLNNSTVSQGIVIKENAKIKTKVTNRGTISANGIEVKGQVGGAVDNQGGTITGDVKIESTGKVGGGIHNSGTINGKIENQGKDAVNINNNQRGNVTGGITNHGTATINNRGTTTNITNQTGANATITNTGTVSQQITNHGTAKINNQGKIQSGIINDGGTLTVINDFRRDENAADGYHTIGEIGKTASGVHIENKSGGKLHINAWYFNKEDYATAEERKANALLVDGDFANISIGDSFINTKGLDVDKLYNSYSLIADKDGNAVGDKVNNGQGIDVNKLHSVSGIYSFENFGGAGQYRANINRDELSGRTLAQSIIYSQRVRNVNLSRILREATTQVFVSGKESEVNANGKSLSQLEQLHTNHRDENTKNHTFVIPY
ncbi:beta strand repeat-containing protein, partial [Campylobacter vulpis]|uniref:beta strand repeat-containing protein n=2 Tax=Campylobacter vulpis TaxID=1655500 RepID=UPI001BD09C44